MSLLSEGLAGCHPFAEVRMSKRDRLLAPGEVARLLCVDRKTIARMADRGALPAIRTLGGHRRFTESDVLALVRASLPQLPVPGSPQLSGSHR